MGNCLIEELGKCRHWVCWRKEVVGKEGRTTKVPYIADARRKRASTTRPEDWKSYQDVQNAMRSGMYTGCGFVLSLTLPYICIDIDHCLDTKTGELTEMATAILALMAGQGGTYTEISPSGDGLHIWGIASLPQGKDGKEKAGIRKDISKADKIEIYRGSRYMTVTGNDFVNEPLRDIQPAVDEIIHRYDLLGSPQTEKPRVDKPIMQRPPKFEGFEFDDRYIINKLRCSQKQGAKFQALFDRGDMTGYADDQSRADCALLSMLAWWTNGNAAQMERIFMSSKLAETLDRKKRHEGDYLQRTINRALEKWQESGGGCYWPQHDIVLKVHFPKI